MNRTCRIVLVLAGLAPLAASAAGQTYGSNGAFGAYERQPAALPFVWLAGNQIGMQNFKPHSTIVARNGVIRDDAFATLLVNNLNAGVNRKHDSLLIHMAQCFSGGFVDDVEDAGMRATMINTAASWYQPSYGDATGNKYSRAWINAMPARPPAADTKMKAAYSTGVTNDGARFHATNNPAGEKPQYYATSNAMDDDKVGKVGTHNDKATALLFIGDNRDYDKVNRRYTTAARHWNDLSKMYVRLRERGYGVGDIYVYNYDSARGASATRVAINGVNENIFIDGPATTANFDDFFNTVVSNNIAGQNDQVFVWTSDHGGTDTEWLGKAQFVPLPGRARPGAKMKMNLGPGLLNGVTSSMFGDAEIFGVPVSNLGDGSVDVTLSDSLGQSSWLLGQIVGETAWRLTVPGETLESLARLGDPEGSLVLTFEGGTTTTEVNDFTFRFFGQAVPAPGPLALAGLGTLLVASRRRRLD